MGTNVDWNSVDDVMLDMDGTVLDLAFDNFYWGEAVPAAYAKLRGMSLESARAELEPEFQALRGTLPWYSLSHWSALTGLDLAALKREHRERITPLPGADEFVQAVRRSGRRVWLVTNADPTALDIKLLKTGLEQRFDRIISSHEFGVPKENADFWGRLQALYPHDRNRTLFVDDSPPVLAAARAAGVGQVLGMRWPDSARPARDIPEVSCVDRLADLLPVPAA